MITAKKIEAIVNTRAAHVLYRKDGGWYHHLNKFPGVLFDYNGYIVFKSKEEYESCPALIHRQDLNVKGGISSLPGYKKFTSVEVKRIKSLNLIHNKLDTSEDAWQTLITNARNAQRKMTPFFSPIQKHYYQIKSVTNNTIIIRRENGKDSKIGKQFFLKIINEIVRNKNKIARTILDTHVAKISAIVFLHPLLKWSDDYQEILVKDVTSEKKMLKTVQSDLDSADDENSYDFEGGTQNKLVSYYERKPSLRAKAILIHGTTCKVCKFNFKEHYGTHGEDYIEVHHIVPIHTLSKSTRINPATDMIVVCANCHRMIHRKKYKPLSIEEIIELRNSVISRANKT